MREEYLSREEKLALMKQRYKVALYFIHLVCDVIPVDDSVYTVTSTANQIILIQVNDAFNPIAALSMVSHDTLFVYDYVLFSRKTYRITDEEIICVNDEPTDR